MRRPYQTAVRLQDLLRYAMSRYTRAWMKRGVHRERQATRWYYAALDA